MRFIWRKIWNEKCHQAKFNSENITAKTMTLWIPKNYDIDELEKSLGILFESLEENNSANKTRKISKWTIRCDWSNDDRNASRNCSIQVRLKFKCVLQLKCALRIGCALGLCAENCSLKIFFSIGTYPELSENCYMGDWTFDNSFLFMGSMATTIGYGHIVPQEMVTNDQSFLKEIRGRDRDWSMERSKTTHFKWPIKRQMKVVCFVSYSPYLQFLYLQSCFRSIFKALTSYPPT